MYLSVWFPFAFMCLDFLKWASSCHGSLTFPKLPIDITCIKTKGCIVFFFSSPVSSLFHETHDLVSFMQSAQVFIGPRPYFKKFRLIINVIITDLQVVFIYFYPWLLI